VEVKGAVCKEAVDVGFFETQVSSNVEHLPSRHLLTWTTWDFVSASGTHLVQRPLPPQFPSARGPHSSNGAEMSTIIVW
jgi:hypothetical protein